MSSKNKIPSWWTTIMSLLVKLFGSVVAKDPVKKAEADVIKKDNLVEATKAKVEAKAIKRKARKQASINNKISKSKKSKKVEDLALGISIYVEIDNRHVKKNFTGYDGKYVYTNDGNKYEYGRVFSWQKNPILKPTKVAK